VKQKFSSIGDKGFFLLLWPCRRSRANRAIRVAARPRKNFTIGYQIGVGLQARVVKTDQGERIAVKRKRDWTWWTVEDRLQPRGNLTGQGD